MADQQLQTILNSGGITAIFLGGVTTADKVLKKSEVDAFDNSATSLAATTQQDALVELANVGLAHMTLVTPYTGGQTIGLTPIKVSLFDTIHHNINGAVTPIVDTSEAVPAHKFTINKNGLFAVYGNVTAEFASSDAVSLQLYKNGAPLGIPVEVQGRGAGKPVAFTYNDLLDLVATDYLEIYAYSDAAATSLLVTAASMIVERKPLQ